MPTLSIVILMGAELLYYLLIAQTGVVEVFHSDLSTIFWLPLGGLLGTVLGVRLPFSLRSRLVLFLGLQALLSLAYPDYSAATLLFLGIAVGGMAPLMILLLRRGGPASLGWALAIAYLGGTLLFATDPAGRGALALGLSLAALAAVGAMSRKAKKIPTLPLSWGELGMMLLWVLGDSALFETLSRDPSMAIWREGQTIPLIALFHLIGVVWAFWRPLDFRGSSRVITAGFALAYLAYFGNQSVILAIVYPFVISYYNVTILLRLRLESDPRRIATAMAAIGWGASGMGLGIALADLLWILPLGALLFGAIRLLVSSSLHLPALHSEKLQGAPMIRSSIFVLFLSAVSLLGAGTLSLEQGAILAHTQVLGDSSIDPGTSRLHASLSAAGDPATLRGTIWVRAKDLRSDNRKRDEHMYEAMEVSKYSKIRYRIRSVEKSGSSYRLKGILTLHGVSRSVTVPATIRRNGSLWVLNGKFRIKMSDYGIKPPKLLFLTVRDAVDLSVRLKMRAK